MEENFIEKLINNLMQDRNLPGDSFNWANWMSKLAFNTCQYCVEQYGKIVDISVLKNKTEVNAHPIANVNTFLCEQRRLALLLIGEWKVRMHICITWGACRITMLISRQHNNLVGKLQKRS